MESPCGWISLKGAWIAFRCSSLATKCLLAHYGPVGTTTSDRSLQYLRSEKWQNESSTNFLIFCPEFPPEFCSEFSPNFLRNFRASLPRKRRPEQIHPKSPRFFNATFPGKHEKKIHKMFVERRQSNNIGTPSPLDFFKIFLSNRFLLFVSPASLWFLVRKNLEKGPKFGSCIRAKTVRALNSREGGLG